MPQFSSQTQNPLELGFFKCFEDVHILKRKTFFKGQGITRYQISDFIYNNVNEYEFVRVSRQWPEPGRIETLFGYVQSPRDSESDLKPEMLLGVLCKNSNDKWCFVPFIVRHEEIVEIEVYTFKIPVVFHDQNDQDKVKEMLLLNRIPPPNLGWFKLQYEPVSQLKSYRKKQPIAIVASIKACQRNMSRIEILLTRKIPIFIIHPPRTRYKDIVDELYSRQEVADDFITDFAKEVPNLRNLRNLLARTISGHFKFD